MYLLDIGVIFVPLGKMTPNSHELGLEKPKISL